MTHFEAPACPVCSGREHRVISPHCAAGVSHAIPGAILGCNRCGMWYKAPFKMKRVEESYDQTYAEQALAGTYMDGDYTRAFFRKILSEIHYETGSRQPRLLDIGCGMGTFLDEARKQGYKTEGIELCEPLAKIARDRGISVHCMDAATMDASEEYDVVTALDLIEHTLQPMPLLCAAWRCLKPGGELVLYTPNHRSAVVYLARCLSALKIDFAFQGIFGENHVSFFDDRTLCRALHDAQFTLRRMWKFPYDPRRPGTTVSVPSLVAIRAVEELGRPFGAVFRMVAYARKK